LRTGPWGAAYLRTGPWGAAYFLTKKEEITERWNIYTTIIWNLHQIQSVPFKTKPKTITYCGTKTKLEAGPPPCNRLSKPPHWHSSQDNPGHCSCQLHRSCAFSNMIYSLAERYFALKSLPAVREAFSNVYPDKEALNKITIHQLVTQFRDTGSVYLCS
jgi:hypothetical protein